MGAHMIAFGTGRVRRVEGRARAVHRGAVSRPRRHRCARASRRPGTTKTEFSQERDGNDPPFPSDPATTASPDEVADAIVRALDDDRFLTFATERDAATAAAKAADPNAFLATMRDRLGALERATPARNWRQPNRAHALVC